MLSTDVSKKVKVAIVAIIMLLAVIFLVILVAPNKPEEPIIPMEEFVSAKENSVFSEELAEVILQDAEISYSVRQNYEPFISNVNGSSFLLYYTDWDDVPYCLEVQTGIGTDKFLENYEVPDSFVEGYYRGISWEYTQNDDILTPYLAVTSKVVVSDEEHWGIMSEQPHVSWTGNLVEAIKRWIPFEISDGDCFFVIDEFTRMEGWFYFKSTYNGEPFIGCYEVDGWDRYTFYQDLITLNGFKITEIQEHVIWISEN